MFKHYLTHITGVIDGTGLEIGTVSRESSHDCYLHPCNSQIGEQMLILPAKNKLKDEIVKLINFHPSIKDNDKDCYAVPVKFLYPTMKVKVDGATINLASAEDFNYSDLLLKKE